MKKEYSLIAERLAEQIHVGQVDRAGVDYFKGHLSTVAANFEDDDIAKPVAYLHDSVEDQFLYGYHEVIELLIMRGVDNKVAIEIGLVVDAMSKREYESYDEYLVRVKQNPIAVRVKLKDIAHNMDLSRLKKVSNKDLKRVEKYRKAVEFLES